MSSLEEIERQIAELEAQVSSSTSSSSEGSDSEDDDELLPIPKLPPHLVCAPGLLLSNAATFAKSSTSGTIPSSSNDTTTTSEESTGNKKRIECRACDSAVFWGEEAFKKHARTIKHRQNVILKAGAAYAPANHESNYCRACNFRAEETEELMKHRMTSEHKEAAAALARASFCQLCKKQFTSPLQLREHIIGKAHKDKVESKTGFRPPPTTDADATTNKRSRRY